MENVTFMDNYFVIGKVFAATEPCTLKSLHFAMSENNFERKWEIQTVSAFLYHDEGVPAKASVETIFKNETAINLIHFTISCSVQTHREKKTGV